MKLSIITINYNNKKGLLDTIKSVISQTFTDYEWIVIDGGSTDGSKELLETYSEHISHWVSEPDKGIYNAMNKGIRQAKGDYLMFLNSGDFLHAADTLLNVFKRKFTEDIIYGNVSFSPSGGKVSGPHSDNVTLFDLISGGFCHQSSFIKRDLFASIGLYDESYKIVSDWAFFVDAVLSEKTFKYINLDISFYDEKGISSQKENLEKHKRERLDVLTKRLPKAVIYDYKNHFYQNEIRKYKYSRIVFSFLYRLVIFYERMRLK